MPRPAFDLTGRRFGRLTAIARAQRTAAKPYWVCRCQCGATSEVRSTHLLAGDARSCGCLARELARAAGRQSIRHGHARKSGGTRSAEYLAWISMKGRCLNPRDRKYPNYGGRGITVCARWRESFENFLADLGPRPSPAHSLDRVDNDRGYDPGNCRWATRVTQQNNRRACRVLVIAGHRLTVAEAARKYGIPYAVLSGRVRHSRSVSLNGVTVEVA